MSSGELFMAIDLVMSFHQSSPSLRFFPERAAMSPQALKLIYAQSPFWTAAPLLVATRMAPGLLPCPSALSQGDIEIFAAGKKGGAHPLRYSVPQSFFTLMRWASLAVSAPLNRH